MPKDTPNDIFVGRQPILDRDEQLVAYELLFRNSQKNAAEVADDMAATATVVTHVFSQFGVEAALGSYLGFINVDEHLLMTELLEALPRTKIVLEILETVQVTPELERRCRELKDMGFTLALDDFIGEEEKYRPILPFIDIVKVDVQPLSEQAIRALTPGLRQWPVKLLAEKVDSREQAALLRSLGYDLFQGYYFARPTIMAGKKLSSSELALMRLFGLLMQDAETSDLEKALKTEPALTLNLLRLTNSAANAPRAPITSLRQAITMLGRRQLQRWLQLLLYTTPGGSVVSNPLLQMAATRGRFMELVMLRMQGGNEQQDRAFMAGIMSLMPALLALPMDEILKDLPIAADVGEALLRRGGRLGKLLALAEALEDTDGRPLDEVLPSGLDATGVNQCLSEALAWANSIGRES
ncbi:MAG: EAL domain-containing protein [Rhodocyclaceae bacterium]|nr:EAL domain-containing protein [Rhodocyclaceae bacterium]